MNYRQPQSFFSNKYHLNTLHPVTGERYEFKVTAYFQQDANQKQMEASVTLTCWRGAQFVRIFEYQIERMNNFSLLAFVQQYCDLLYNWLSVTPVEEQITQAERAFSAGPGPVVKITGKMIKSLDIELIGE
jgi:hypothetical protein